MVHYLSRISVLLLISSQIAFGAFSVPDKAIIQVKLANRATGSTVGAGGVAVSSSTSGGYNTTSSSFSDVTNLTVTLTTTGRPVKVFMQPSASTGTSCFVEVNSTSVAGIGEIALNRDGGSNIYVSEFSSSSTTTSSVEFPPSSFSFLDFPAAGSHTYKLQARVHIATSSQVVVSNCNLVAYEI